MEKTTASLVCVMFLTMILVRKAESKSTSPLRHIASYDRSNVRCDDSKKDQAKEKKTPQKTMNPVALLLKCIPSFSTELDKNRLAKAGSS